MLHQWAGRVGFIGTSCIKYLIPAISPDYLEVFGALYASVGARESCLRRIRSSQARHEMQSFIRRRRRLPPFNDLPHVGCRPGRLNVTQKYTRVDRLL